MTTDAVLNLNQAREFLGVSEKTLRNYCKAGKLAFHHEKNLRGVMEYRFRQADLLDFLARKAPASNTAQGAEKGMNTGREPAPLTNDGKSLVHDVAVAASQTSPAPGTVSVGQPPQYDVWSQYSELGRQLVTQLQAEVLFLKEQLQEKDRQIAMKDKQLERHMERISTLNEHLASLALGKTPDNS